MATSRAMFAGSVSLSLHGGMILLVIALVGLRATRPPATTLIPIEVVAPAPVTAAVAGPGGEGTRAGAGNAPKSGAIGRRDHDAPKRSQTQAPPVRDPYADVVIGFDAPDTAETGTARGTLIGVGVGTGLTGTGPGDGAGVGRFGDGPGLGVPAPPASHARPPRPVRDYSHETLTRVRKYNGKKMVVGLAIDPHGRVAQVHVIEGVDPAIDRQAVAAARTFAFYPALRDDGEPRWGTFRWDFVIEVPFDPNALDPDADGQGSLLWRERVRSENY